MNSFGEQRKITSAKLQPGTPALILAPMDGVTDAPMRALQGELGVFDFTVSEFVRVSNGPVPEKVFVREVPELLSGGRTRSGMPVQVQILGGDPDLMAESAWNAYQAGATSLDINFGCPAPTVNRRDGGATILQFPRRISEIVRAVRDIIPSTVPVSAKVRLGWEKVDEIDEIARQVQIGGASWIVVHARTKMQRYTPPVFWKHLGRVKKNLDIPVVANGDIWTLDDFRRCQEESECLHFMLGRGALADPRLPSLAARELGLQRPMVELDWSYLLSRLSHYSQLQIECRTKKTLHRLKQWLNMARRFGDFAGFDEVKRCQTEQDFFDVLASLQNASALLC